MRILQHDRWCRPPGIMGREPCGMQPTQLGRPQYYLFTLSGQAGRDNCQPAQVQGKTNLLICLSLATINNATGNNWCGVSGFGGGNSKVYYLETGRETLAFPTTGFVILLSPSISILGGYSCTSENKTQTWGLGRLLGDHKLSPASCKEVPKDSPSISFQRCIDLCHVFITMWRIGQRRGAGATLACATELPNYCLGRGTKC